MQRLATGTAILINADVVTHFTKLPNHLRTWNGEGKGCIHFQLFHTGGQVGLQCTVAPLTLLVSHTFLVMAFHEANPHRFAGVHTAEITIRRISHGRLTISVVYIPPEM